MDNDTYDNDRSKDGACVFPVCEAPQTEHLRLPMCERHILKTYRLAHQMVQDTIAGMREGARRGPLPGARDTDQGLVYFLRLGSLVKIGFTRNLDGRLKAVPHEDLLATIPGTMRDEKALHKRFEHLRHTGEWFRSEQDLEQFIAEIPVAA